MTEEMCYRCGLDEAMYGKYCDTCYLDIFPDIEGDYEEDYLEEEYEVD